MSTGTLKPIIHPQITLAAMPAPLSPADTKVKQQLKPLKGTAAATQLEAI